MNNKKIMLYCSSLGQGGTERVAANLTNFFAEQGNDVVLVTQYRREGEYDLSPNVNRILSDISGDKVSGSRVKNFVARYKKLRRIVKEQKPDCILSFIGKNNFMMLAAAAFTGIPVVVSVRAEPAGEYDSAIMRLLAKTLFVGAAGVILQTEEAKKFFPRYIRKKAVILKNPLNGEFIREPYRGKRNGKIVSVGRIDDNKNHAMLIKAFARIADEFPQSGLLICGEGERRKDLIDLCKQLGVSNRVSLPGSVSNVAEKIAQSSVFALCSDSEGMPNALIEAMCLGIPCISTDCPCGGPGELIKDGENGFLIPVRDEDALTDRLRTLLGDPVLAAKIGFNAAKLAQEYHPDRVNRQWQEYLFSRMGGSKCAE